MIGAIAAHYVEAAAPSADYATEVLADTPLAYWRMGDTAGTTCTDSSGNGRHATYAGSPTLGVTGLVTGDADKAVEFTGTTAQRAEITAAAWMNPTVGITLEAIVKPDDFSNYRSIVDRDLAPYRTWGLRVNQTTGKVEGLVWSQDDAASSPTSLVSTTALTVGTKCHVALTWDGATVRLYINGTLNASVAKSGSMKSSSSPICIGVTHGGSSSAYFSPFDGVIDEVAFYGTALSAARISAHAAAAGEPPAVPLPDPVADDFNRADGALGSTSVGARTWVTAGTGTWAIASNQCRRSGTGDGNAVINTGIADNYAVQVTVRELNGTFPFAIIARGSSATSFVSVFRWGGDWRMAVDGSVSGTAQAGALAVGDVVRVEVTGTTYKVFVNGTQQATYTTSSHATGADTFQGIRGASGTVMRCDDFSVTPL